MSGTTVMLLAMAVPAVAAVLIALLHDRPNPREAVTLVAAVVMFGLVATLLPDVLAGERPTTGRWILLPGLQLQLALEPLGMLFALVASFLWIVNSIYSIGYMRGNDEPRQASFYVCFAVALAATLGIAFAGTLFTLFLFYEVLTLVTYPLVIHKQTPEALRAGRIYLTMLIGSSIVFFLVAIIWLYWEIGTTEFATGGIVGDIMSPGALAILLLLFAFGIGKAALMPLHFWLPAAMVAPTPVSALLHAVAVVKAGVFAIVKIVVYIFGLEALQGGVSDWLVYYGSGCLLLSSVIALTRDNLKARLAYSTVSQLAYVIVGAALATKLSVVGSGLHIAMHAAGKITLFFCAGAIYVAHHLTEVSQLNGIGRRMPLTMTAFLLGSLSIIGLPPFGGTWSKWMLGLGALEAGHVFVLAVLMLSSLLNVGYLLSIVARAFFLPVGAPEAKETGVAEAPFACLLAISVTALLCIVLFFQAGQLEALLLGIFGL